MLYNDFGSEIIIVNSEGIPSPCFGESHYTSLQSFVKNINESILNLLAIRLSMLPNREKETIMQPKNIEMFEEMAQYFKKETEGLKILCPSNSFPADVSTNPWGYVQACFYLQLGREFQPSHYWPNHYDIAENYTPYVQRALKKVEDHSLIYFNNDYKITKRYHKVLDDCGFSVKLDDHYAQPAVLGEIHQAFLFPNEHMNFLRLSMGECIIHVMDTDLIKLAAKIVE